MRNLIQIILVYFRPQRIMRYLGRKLDLAAVAQRLLVRVEVDFLLFLYFRLGQQLHLRRRIWKEISIRQCRRIFCTLQFAASFQFFVSTCAGRQVVFVFAVAVGLEHGSQRRIRGHLPNLLNFVYQMRLAHFLFIFLNICFILIIHTFEIFADLRKSIPHIISA